MKKVISIACAIGIAGMMIGCGDDSSSSSAIEQTTDTVVLEKTTVGKDNVALTPVSGEIVSDKYAYTTSDLGLVALVESSTPVYLPKDDNDSYIDENNDTALKNLITSSDNNEPLIVSSKVAKKPIRSNDGVVIILPKFNPKLPFDVSVAVTNYKSLLALPNNGLDLLNKDYAPVATVSSDIAFYNTNGKRIWDINKKFVDNDTNVSFYLVFDAEKSGLKEGSYKLAVYKNGEYEYKDINITKKSNGTLTAAVKGVYPFIIAKKGGVITKDGQITNPFEKTSFKFAVVALDENGSVVGVGKVENNNLSLKALSNPKKYELVSYIFKNNKVETNTTNIEITADMLNPEYPLYDNMSQDDKKQVSYIKEEINEMNEDVSVSDFLNPQEYYCDEDSPVNSEELCEDFKATINSLLNGEANDELKEEYQADNNVTCKVTKNIDINNTTIKVSCTKAGEEGSLVNTLNIKTTDAKKFNFDFSLNFSTDDKSENEKTTFTYVKDNNTKYVTNVVDIYSENENESEQSEYSNYSQQTSENYTTKIKYINGKYVYNQTGSYSNTYTSTYYENNEESSYNESLSFSYELSTVYDGVDTNDENHSKFSAKVDGIQASNSSDNNITINGKKLVFTKDKDGYWHVNMSSEGF